MKVIHISKTNFDYVKPHKLEINDIAYIFFYKCEDVYINTIEKFILFNELETYIEK